jgi:large subunit ribosomal protein L27
MAHKKAGGSTSLGRDSQSKRLGTKLYDGEFAKIGSIVVRQRGSKIRPGINVKKGNDDTLFAIAAGIVKFSQKKIKKFNGHLVMTKFANVFPIKK